MLNYLLSKQHQMLLFTLVISFLVYTCSIVENIVSYEPYSLLKLSELLFLMPFDGANANVAPSFTNGNESFRYPIHLFTRHSAKSTVALL